MKVKIRDESDSDKWEIFIPTKPTHERNVLVWLASLWRWEYLGYLIPIAWVILGAMLLASCVSLTQATELRETRNQILAYEYAQCHAIYHKIFNVRVFFVDTKRADGALAWASLQGRSITLVAPELEKWSPVDIEMIVGHEVCHVKGIFDEGIATVCASDAYYNAGCH